MKKSTRTIRKKSGQNQVNGPPRPEWKPLLNCYRDKKVLRFENDKELEAAIDLLWTDTLRELPHSTFDGKSIIIPAEALEYFSRAGLKFTVEKLRSINDLTPEEIAKLRK